MNVTNIKNGPLYDFNEFDFFLTLPLVGGVFLWSAPGERSGDGALDGMGQKRCRAALATALQRAPGQAMRKGLPRLAKRVDSPCINS